MAKLYFKFGAMGSSKSAQALITKFNYEELGMTVWLIKPSTDTRDGADLIRSRIGLSCKAQVITPEQSILKAYRAAGRHDVRRPAGAVLRSPNRFPDALLPGRAAPDGAGGFAYRNQDRLRVRQKGYRQRQN